MARHNRRLRHRTQRRLELLDGVIRRDHHRVRLDPHRHPVARLDQRHMLALRVEEVVHDSNGSFQQHLARPLPRALFLQRPQDRQRHRIIRPDQPGAVAMRAGLRGGFQHPRTQPLPAHLQKPEARNPPDLNPRAVGLQLVLQPLLDGGVVAPLFHVDEVDDDQPGKVAQPQLPRNLFRRLDVGLQRGFLDRAFLGRPARVHVDRHQSLGDADHDVAAGFQLHHRVEHARQIAFHLILGEQGRLVLIAHHLLGVARHDHPHEVLGGAIAALALDQHLVDLAAVKVTDRAFDQIAFLIDLRRGNRLQRQLADLLPEPHQIFVVALDLGLGPLGPRRAHDQASTFRHLQLARDFLQLLPIHRIGDLAGNPAAPGRVRHQHAVAARQRQIGGQRRALVAALFLHHLDQHDLPDLHHFLNLVAPGARAARLGDFLGHVLFGDGFNFLVGVAGVIHGAVTPARLLLDLLVVVVVVVIMGMVMSVIVTVIVPGVVLRQTDRSRLHQRPVRNLVLAKVDHIHPGRALPGRAFQHGILDLDLFRLHRRARRATPRAAVLFLFLGAGHRPLFLDQRLTVGDRDLVVVGVDFGEGQETMPVPAIFHEGRLQRRFDPRHLGQVDVPGQLALVYGLEIEFFDLVSVDHDHPGFLGMGGVDKHFL